MLKTLFIASFTFLAGCAQLVDQNGDPISLKSYDSVIVDEVTLEQEVPYDGLDWLTRESLIGKIRMSRLWDRTHYKPDPEQEARSKAFWEDYRRRHMPAGMDIRSMERSQKGAPKLPDKPFGERPVHARVIIHKVHVPSKNEQFWFGGGLEANWTMVVYEDLPNRPLGSVEHVSAYGDHREGFISGGMILVLSSPPRDFPQPDSSLFLATQIAKDAVDILERAKKRSPLVLM